MLQNQKIFNLNDTEIKNFTENIGCSFGLVSEWMKYLNEDNSTDPKVLDGYLNLVISKEIMRIKEAFSTKKKLFKLLKNGCSLIGEFYHFSYKQRNFLITQNFVRKTQRRQVVWHDKLRETAFQIWKRNGYDE